MNKTIQLSKKYSAHDKVFDAVVIREPTYADAFMEGLGKPMDVTYTGAGPVMITHPQVIDGYLQRLVVEPGYECISHLSVADSLKLEKAVVDFFLDTKISENSQTG